MDREIVKKLKIKEMSINIKQNLLNLGETIKRDALIIKANTKALWAVVKKDRVDLAMFLIAIIVSVLDFATDIALKGGLAFFTVYISSLIFRMTVWKYKYAQKEEKFNQ